MHLTPTPEQEQFIHQELSSGRYASANDLLSAALQLLAQHHYAQWAQDVGEKVAIAAAELERGEGVDGETAIVQLKERLRKAHEA